MQDFIKISRYAGMRNDLAQAGGGNTSVKLDDRFMLVKSSGFQLADVGEQTGYTKVDYRKIVEYFEQNLVPSYEGTDSTGGASFAGDNLFTEKKGEELLREAQTEGGRASIETFLHAVTGKYTLHSHPTLVNILTARTGGMETLGELFPGAVMVPYRKPGAALAEAYYKTWKTRQAACAGKPGQDEAGIIFLENHGLVVSGESGDEVIEKTEQVLYKIAEFLQIDDSAYRRATEIFRTIRQIEALSGLIVYVSENRYLSEEYAGKELVEKGLWEHAFCPDCVVYANKKILKLPEQYTGQDFLDFMEENGLPTLLYLEKHFYILAESVKKAQEIENVMSFAARVQYENRSRDMNYLTDAQREELLNWDSEKYRRKMK